MLTAVRSVVSSTLSLIRTGFINSLCLPVCSLLFSFLGIVDLASADTFFLLFYHGSIQQRCFHLPLHPRSLLEGVQWRTPGCRGQQLEVTTRSMAAIEGSNLLFDSLVGSSTIAIWQGDQEHADHT